MRKIVCIFVAVLVFVCECTELEMLENDYELIDGISVPRKGKVIRHKGKEKDDEGDTDDDNYEDEITEDDAPEEDVELTKDLPTKCHVCRLLVIELEEKLSSLGRVRKERKHRAPIYYKEDKVILNAVQNLCKRMKNYNIRRSQPFRYKKGVKSYFRRQLQDATKDSKIKQFMFFTPEDDIDDPTGEIHRLQKQCHALLVDNQHDLIHWFHKAQSHDLTTWFCRDRVLVNDNIDCLDQEIPTIKKKTPPRNGEKENTLQVEENNTNKTTLKHVEL